MPKYTVRLVPANTLSEQEWTLLESSDWFVDWGGRYFCHTRIEMPYVERARRVKELPDLCADKRSCPGHRICESLAEAKRLAIKIFGAYAWGASLTIESDTSMLALWKAITAWEHTGLTVSMGEDYFYVVDSHRKVHTK